MIDFKSFAHRSMFRGEYNCIITSELANQCAPKALFTCVVHTNNNYCVANPVLGKSLCPDWFFLGQECTVRTVSMETVQPMYFCFGAKPANSKFATKTAKKKL